MTTVAIVPAAGEGKRLGASVSKAFVEIGGRPILFHTIDRLASCGAIERYIVPVSPETCREPACRYERWMQARKIEFVEGGSTRTRSVANAMARLGEPCDLVLVHDAARPLVEVEVVRAAIEAASRTGAAIVAAPCCDTVKEADGAGLVRRTLRREGLWLVQTPQVFRRALIERAYAEALRLGIEATDDSALVERLGEKVEIVPSSPSNLKITTPVDLELFRLRIYPNNRI